jgi:vacuolar-type H+-ATPase subunit C/Vma6
MRSQGLLKTLNECEYPADFLVARLLGKKSNFFRNWEFLLSSSDAVQSLQDTPFYHYLKRHAAPGIWRFLSNEYQWVYKNMNNGLRTQFESYFVYHEINTLLACLRYLSSNEESENVLQELHKSLLHDDIQEILTGISEFTEMLQVLELRLRSYSELFNGLTHHYEKSGIAALEIFIRDGYFTSIFSKKQSSMLMIFFQYLVDYHNSISMAKAIRWKVEPEPTMISGGTVPMDRFKRAYFRKDVSPVLTFLRIQNTNEATSTIQKLETALLSFITGKLKCWSFQRTRTGDILFYLWEQYRYTRNISMVLNTSLLDDEPVRESIVA